MTHRKPKNDALYVRVTSEQKKAFNDEAAKYEPLTPSDVLRELAIGFAEGRVTIVPPDNKKESLYVPRNQD